MKKNILLVFVLSLVFASCHCRHEKPEKPKTEHTLFIYMPWSTTLTSSFNQNLKDFEAALNNNLNLLKNNKVVVFFSSTADSATMFEFKYEKNNLVRAPLKKYKNSASVFTTESGITSIFNDVKSFASANRYSMIMSGHGMGWLPVVKSKASRGEYEKYHWEYEGVPLTRFIGGKTPDVQTEITTLAKGIKNAGIKMDYILFDACYMSTIETAYDLKDVANYIVACPTEIMDYGFPYAKIGKFLIGDINFQGVIEGFYDFYLDYKINDKPYPYGTIAVTVTAELDNLATVMKEINQTFSFDMEKLNEVQRMDGYSPVIFFDMGDYVSKLCTDVDLLAKFNYRLEQAVPLSMSRHTESYYSTSIGAVYINAYSGVTISDPSINSSPYFNVVVTSKIETAWYKATH